jgi:hypothetical protein
MVNGQWAMANDEFQALETKKKRIRQLVNALS